MSASLPSPRRSNCIFWACRCRRRHGGGLFVRPSYYVRWLFHVAWVPYVGAPTEEMLGYTARRIQKWYGPWFRGHVTTEAIEYREFRADWTREDTQILRARAFKGADQMSDIHKSLKVYSDYIASLNL